ncbi:hypothetical protein ERJ75_000805100 [Trypanosoma vivax]|nr:hypothetical protein ERJ75_000805100 [Trypanosoma vivax]
MRQPRTQVLRSDAKAVSTRVAEGNLALTTEEREEARRTKGPREAGTGRGQRAAGPTGKRDERRAAGDKASTHGLLSRRRRGASVADRRRGATYGKGAGQLGEGNYWEAGARKSDVGRAGGKRAAAPGPRSLGGRAGTGPGQQRQDAERNARKETASFECCAPVRSAKAAVGQRGGGVFCMRGPSVVLEAAAAGRG